MSKKNKADNKKELDERDPLAKSPKQAGNGVINFVEGVAGWLSDVFKGNLQSFIDVEAVDSEHILVTDKGSLLSALKIEGTSTAVGGDEFEAFMETLVRTLTPAMRNPGTVLDFFFYVDPDGIQAQLAQINKGVRQTGRVLQLDTGDILDSRENYLSKFTALEACYLIVWTNSSALATSDKGDAKTEAKELRKNTPTIPITKQPLLVTVPALRERQEATLFNLERELRTARLMTTRVDVRTALRVARQHISPLTTSSTWNPIIPGDRVPMSMLRNNGRMELDAHDIMYPTLSQQLLPEGAERINDRHVQIGDMFYGPMQIEIPPQTVTPFQNLFMKMKDASIPYRVMIRLESGGMRFVSTKRTLTSLLSWAKGRNKLIKEAVDEMTIAASREPLIRYQISLCTWAPTIELLRTRHNQMVQLVSSWGDCEVRTARGDPLELLFDSVPFVRERMVSNACVAPLADICRMLPILRPASPWESGSVLYRSSDGKVLPFAPGSSMQTTWAYLMIALPGSGKSLLLMNMLLGSILEAGVSRLPLVSILDIGPSSKGLITLIRDALPPDLKRYASHFRMRMTPEYAINPLDTQLGCRYPTPEHKQFLVNLITQLVTPPESNSPFTSMAGLVSKVIDKLYLDNADGPQSNPKSYRPNICSPVDAMVQQYAGEFTPYQDTTWWDVVDFFFKKGHLHEAMMAQRFAVPLLPEAAGAAKTQVLRDLYHIVVPETGELLTDAFSRLLADTLTDFSILTQPTKFDIGDVRIAAIDVEEIAKTGSVAADRQTALIYLIAKYALTKDYRLTPQAAENMPKLVRAYHIERAAQIREDKKWVVMDEFHRTAAAAGVQAEVLVDMREGRKWNMGVILSSQSEDDFSDELIKQTTGRFILRATDRAHANALQKKFGFNNTTKELMLEYCHGPSAKGAPFIGMLATKQGEFTQLMYSTISPVEAWGLTTTAEDTLIRDRVSAVVGPKEARARLGRAYPVSAKDVVEKLKLAHAGSATSDDSGFNAIKEIAEKILEAPAIHIENNIGAVRVEDLNTSLNG